MELMNLEAYAIKSPARKLNPYIRVFLSVGALFIAVVANSPASSIYVFLFMLILILFFARIPSGVVFKLLVLPMSFVIPASLVIAFLQGEHAIFSLNTGFATLRIYREGVMTSVETLFRSLAGISSLYFLILTTTMSELFSILKSMRFPDFFIEISMMVYRFIFIFLEEMEIMVTATASRLGFSNFRSHLRSFGMLGSMLFIKTLEKGEKIQIAMESRCYDGKIPYLKLQFPPAGQIILLILILLSMTMVSMLYR